MTKSELRIFVIYISSLMYTVVRSLHNSHKLEVRKTPSFTIIAFKL